MAVLLSYLRARSGLSAHCKLRELNPPFPPFLLLLQADAVISILEDKDPEEKVLIFSEYANTLHAIRLRLPSIGLQSRHLLGRSGAGGWACGRGPGSGLGC